MALLCFRLSASTNAWFWHPTLLAPGDQILQDAGPVSPAWENIRDLFGSHRQDWEPSDTLRGGGGRSLFVPFAEGSRGDAAATSIFIFSPVPAGAREAAGQMKAGRDGRRRENPNPGWAGTGVTRVCGDRRAQGICTRDGILSGGSCARGQGCVFKEKGFVPFWDLP